MVTVKDIRRQAREGQGQRGCSREQQHQDANTEDADASRGREGKGKPGAGEDGQRGCHLDYEVAGAADFLAAFADFAGATSLAPADGSIDGTSMSVPAAIKAVSSFHNVSGTERT